MAAIRRCFFLPFHGETGEDRWSWARDQGGQACYVLCDGASESYDGAAWAATLAQVLAKGLLQRKLQRPLQRKLPGGAAIQNTPPIDRQYFINLVKRAQKQYAQHSVLVVPGEFEWLNRQALARGSWSTVLALRFSRQGSFADLWSVGDTMLFLRDGQRYMGCFPPKTAQAVLEHPPLVPSRGPVPSALYHTRIDLHGLKRPRLIMVSDALGYYLLSREEAERIELWDFFCRAPQASCISWLMNEQRCGALAADDYTLLELVP